MRDLSDSALQSTFDQRTDQVWLVFLTIDHASLAAPIRLVMNEEDVIKGGETYIAFPFEIELPGESGEQLPSARLRIANADRMIMDQIRSTITLGAPEVTIEIGLASSPDVVEYGPMKMSLSDIEYDAFMVTGTLGGEEAMSRHFPADNFDNPNFPALFPG